MTAERLTAVRYLCRTVSRWLSLAELRELAAAPHTSWLCSVTRRSRQELSWAGVGWSDQVQELITDWDWLVENLLKCAEDWEGRVVLLLSELRLVSSQLPLLLLDTSDTAGKGFR